MSKLEKLRIYTKINTTQAKSTQMDFSKIIIRKEAGMWLEVNMYYE